VGLNGPTSRLLILLDYVDALQTLIDALQALMDVLWALYRRLQILCRCFFRDIVDIL